MSGRIFQNAVLQFKETTDRTIGVIDAEGTVIACSELTGIGKKWAKFVEPITAAEGACIALEGKCFKALPSWGVGFDYAVFASGDDSMSRTVCSMAAVALNAAKESGQTVAVFSLEMSRDQLVTRLLASEGLIENTRLISGDLRESDWVKIAEGASSLSRLDIRIDDNPLLTVADMNAKCRRIENLALLLGHGGEIVVLAAGLSLPGKGLPQIALGLASLQFHDKLLSAPCGSHKIFPFIIPYLSPD